jgi:tetratricopeptide (TPR) repeat protein
MEGTTPGFGGPQREEDSARDTTSAQYIGTSAQTSQEVRDVIKPPRRKITVPHFLRKPRVAPVAASSSKAIHIVKKFWYVGVVLLLIVVVAIVWQTRQAAETNKWEKVADYYGKADYAAAAKLLDGTKLPSDPDKLRMYSQSMLATRQLDKALPGYMKLYEVKKDTSVKIVIGNIYNEQKKYTEAEKVYKEIIAANKTNAQTYVNLATLYKLQGKSDEAVAVARQGVESNPGSVVLHELHVSMLLEDKENPEYKKAVESLRKLNPQDPLLEVIKQG